MKSKNELFAQALQWLYTNHECKDQKELSVKTGITETTISRILNNRVKNPSADTIGKLLDAFPMIDRDFLYGWSECVSKYEKFEKMAHDALNIDHERDHCERGPVGCSDAAERDHSTANLLADRCRLMGRRCGDDMVTKTGSPLAPLT